MANGKVCSACATARCRRRSERQHDEDDEDDRTSVHRGERGGQCHVNNAFMLQSCALLHAPLPTAVSPTAIIVVILASLFCFICSEI